jgi:hypothetical protein
MDLQQLTGRCFRLKQELATAYSVVPWNTGRIDRLTDDLASAEREIAGIVALRNATNAAPPAPRRSTQAAPQQAPVDVVSVPRPEGR